MLKLKKNMNAMETKNSSENEESSGEQLDSGIQSLSEMSGGFDASAAAERVRMKKEELSANKAESAESDIESETSEVASIDNPEAAGAEEEAFDAERAVDGKKFEGFFTLEEEKAIYVKALEEDVAKYNEALDRERKILADWQAAKPKPWDFSGKKSQKHAIEVYESYVEESTKELESAQRRLDEIDSLSLEEISGKLGRLVEGEIGQARNEVYLNERNSYYVGKNDEYGSFMAHNTARRAAEKAPLLERTRWKEYGFMYGKSSDNGSTPGRLYKTKEEE